MGPTQPVPRTSLHPLSVCTACHESTELVISGESTTYLERMARGLGTSDILHVFKLKLLLFPGRKTSNSNNRHVGKAGKININEQFKICIVG